MDLSEITDKKEIAYLLVQEQRHMNRAQRNCQLLEKRLLELENGSTDDTTVIAKEEVIDA